jgi:penicillin-binding protein 1A
MTDALKDKPPVDFRIPPGVRLVRVNPATGQLAEGERNAIWEAFKPGTEPTPNDQVVDGDGIDANSIGDPQQSEVPADDQPLRNVGQPQEPTMAGALPPPMPGGVPPVPTSASPMTPAVPPAPATSPSTGTGGLY